MDSLDAITDARPAVEVVDRGRQCVADRSLRKRPGSRSGSYTKRGPLSMRSASSGASAGDDGDKNQDLQLQVTAPEVMSPRTGNAVVASGSSPSTLSDSALTTGWNHLEVGGVDEVHQARQEPTGRLRIGQIQRITEVLIDESVVQRVSEWSELRTGVVDESMGVDVQDMRNAIQALASEMFHVKQATAGAVTELVTRCRTHALNQQGVIQTWLNEVEDALERLVQMHVTRIQSEVREAMKQYVTKDDCRRDLMNANKQSEDLQSQKDDQIRSDIGSMKEYVSKVVASNSDWQNRMLIEVTRRVDAGKQEVLNNLVEAENI